MYWALFIAGLCLFSYFIGVANAFPLATIWVNRKKKTHSTGDDPSDYCSPDNAGYFDISDELSAKLKRGYKMRSIVVASIVLLLISFSCEGTDYSYNSMSLIELDPGYLNESARIYYTEHKGTKALDDWELNNNIRFTANRFDNWRDRRDFSVWMRKRLAEERELEGPSPPISEPDPFNAW